jgi:hypothetical protein
MYISVNVYVPTLESMLASAMAKACRIDKGYCHTHTTERQHGKTLSIVVIRSFTFLNHIHMHAGVK